MGGDSSPKRKRTSTFDVESVRKIFLNCTASRRFYLKERCYRLIESNLVTGFMTVATIYALYSSDVLVLGFQKSADRLFTVFSSICFFLFFIEIILQCWVRESYLRIPTLKGLQHAYYDAILAPRYVDKINILLKACQVGSFYFWLDVISTVSMIFEVNSNIKTSM